MLAPKSLKRLLGALAVPAALVGALPALTHAADAPAGRVGPDLQITGNGRQLHPIGDLTTLGNFPAAAALTPDGRFLWTVDSGHGKDDVQVMDVATGKVVQTLPLPGGYGGVAFAPDGTRAFVSGSPSSSDKAAQPANAKGTGGDVLHFFAVDPATGQGTEKDPIDVAASTGGSGQTNSLPPVQKSYPLGVAVSPDGKTVATALQQADRVALAPVAGGTARMVTVGHYPNSVAFDAAGRAYVSNALDGTVSVVDVTAGRVIATVTGLGGQNGQPEGMVADPRTDRMYVAITQRDQVGVIDTKSLKVVKTISVARPEAVGAQPTALAVDPDGSTLYVADSNEDAVAAIALTDRPAKGASGKSHTIYRPPPVVQLRRYGFATVAEAKRLKSERHKAKSRAAKRKVTRAHARRVDRIHAALLKTARVPACKGPTKKQARTFRAAVLKALRGPAKRRTKALKAAQAKLPAIVKCPAAGAIAGLKAYDLIGKLPVAAYPTAVAVTPNGSRLIWVAGKGFGSGPNPDFAFGGDKRAFGKVETPYGTYVLDKLLGRAGRLSLPTDVQTRSMTKAAEAQTVPANAQAPPGGTPVRAGGPIKHVFYVVRENRTYDQVFGSDPRGDGDPKLELFDDNGVAPPLGGITPNAHALTRKFPLLDHLYADSEVSVDGHVITAGSLANDYDQKAVPQNYSRPGKSFDFGVFPITFGPNGFVFDQAVRQGVTFRNYGEDAAGSLPTAAGTPTYPQVQAGTDSAYPGNAQIGCLAAAGPGANVASCTQDSSALATPGTPVTGGASRISVFNAQFNAQVASGTVPAFNYLILPNDHTNGTTANAYSPQALIADNDLAVGQLVDTISHSSIWASSAIFVVEDDSQDGADHVDSHRMPAFVISPWAKRGAVVHTRYDQYSVLRTAELLSGLTPLSINDALATPMYDAFDTTPDVEGTRYTAIRPEQSMTEVNTAASPMAAMSRALPFGELDLVPQALSDRILYASAHGTVDEAPKPGPNASTEEHERALGALGQMVEGRSAITWLRAHSEPDDDDAPAATRSSGDKTSADADKEQNTIGVRQDSHPLSAATRSAAAAEARRTLADFGDKP